MLVCIGTITLTYPVLVSEWDDAGTVLVTEGVGIPAINVGVSGLITVHALGTMEGRMYAYPTFST